jgi:DNA polymerase V
VGTPAADLAAMSPAVARDIGTVVPERLVHELDGIEYDNFHPESERLQGAAVTCGSFEPISDLILLQEAMARRAWRAAEKIRAQDLVASRLIVFAHGLRLKAGTTSASNSATVSPQTSDPRQIMSLAMRMTEAMFKRGGRY